MSRQLTAIRQELGKPAGTTLHFASNITQHGARIYTCRQIGAMPGLTLTNVVICKRLLIKAQRLRVDVNAVYLYGLRLTLERISWVARDSGDSARITFAHVRRVPLSAAEGLPCPPPRNAHLNRVVFRPVLPVQPAERSRAPTGRGHRCGRDGTGLRG